jgi:hypothetical protein
MISKAHHIDISFTSDMSRGAAAGSGGRRDPGGKMHIFMARRPQPAATRGIEEVPAAGIVDDAAAAGTAALAGHIDFRQLEKSVSWTGGERFRFLWYRLRLTVAEMNYASRRMVDLQMRL